MNRAAAFQVVADFESALGEYTGAPHVVTVDSCTNAIFLSLLWWKTRLVQRTTVMGPLEPIPNPPVQLPRETYVGVAQAARNAGYRIRWRDEAWSGQYRLQPTGVVDAAKRFTSGMFKASLQGDFRWAGMPLLQCVSFQAGKHLPIGRGGAILTDSAEAAAWLRRARFDGRTPGDDSVPIQAPGYHMYLTPPDAARGLWLLSWLPKDNADLPNGEYDDLSQMEAFQ